MYKTCRILITLTILFTTGSALAGDWHELFDGKSLDGWRASENQETFSVRDGAIVASGDRSHLFYEGPVGDHNFKNFELVAEIMTRPSSNSGIFIHTAYQETGWPKKGYEIQVNNTFLTPPNSTYRELKCTGSLYCVRNIHSRSIPDNTWFTMKIRVVGSRIQVWVNDIQTVDYTEPGDSAWRAANRQGRRLSSGTLALQGHDPGSTAMYRSIKIQLLPDDLTEPSPMPENEQEVQSLTKQADMMDQLAGKYVPVIDYHIHLRGGMTVEKAVDRQAKTGINSGVLKNLGKGWPIETDDQLREFLDSVEGFPVFVGLQVNDRDWMDRHAKELLDRLDFVLADTMIMPMPNDDSPPVKLWMPELYTIDDPEAWMHRYVKHNLRVLAEPVTVLANPTYLPPPVEDMYDELWTDERMEQIIKAAIKNNVALEINARSGLPHDRFIRMAKRMGAKFTFGTNNFDDIRIDMSRCLESVDRYGLTKDDMYIPDQINK